MFVRWPRYSQPRPRGRDVVGRALAHCLQQHPQARRVVARPTPGTASSSSSRSEPGATATSTARRIGRRRHEARRARVEARAPAGRRRSADRTRRRSAPSSRPGQRHAHDRLRRADERERVRVAVVAGREVAVERRDDRVRARRRVLALPLADARPAGVGEHGRADRLEIGEQSVALDRRAHLLGTGRDHERRLHRHALRRRLARDVRGPSDVLVGRVRARTDERGRDLDRDSPPRSASAAISRDRPVEVGRVRADEVRFERRQVDLDHAVVEPLGIGVDLGVVAQVLGVRVGEIGDRFAARSPSGTSPCCVVVREERARRADLGAHVADRRLARRRDRRRARTEVLDDRARAALHGEDARDLQDDVLRAPPSPKARR